MIMGYTYEYPRAGLSADCVVIGVEDRTLSLLLIERAHPPFQGCWALPGGFLEMDETLESAAARELEEETGIVDVKLEQIGAFSQVDRDPRDRIVTVAYLGVVPKALHRAQAASDARQAQWFPLHALPVLAFDHQQIFQAAIAKMHANPFVWDAGSEGEWFQETIAQIKKEIDGK